MDGLLSSFGQQQDQGGGGLLGSLTSPDKMAYLAMMAKGLSPYSDVDPSMFMRLAQQQKQNSLQEREFAFRKQEANRQQSNQDRTFGENQLTPAAKAARDFGLTPGQPEYKDFMNSFYQLKGEGYTPVTIKQNGDDATVFQDKQGRFHKPEDLIPGLNTATPTGADAIPPPPPGADPKEWRKEQTKMRAAKDAQQPGRERTATNVIEDIDRAEKLIDGGILPTTGFAGQALSNIGGTGAHDLNQVLNSIGANISFDKLQQMRSESPTGGALGNVSDKENAMLQSVLGSVKQSQSADQLKFNLKRLRDTYDAIVHGPKKSKDGPSEDKPKMRLRYDPATGTLK